MRHARRLLLLPSVLALSACATLPGANGAVGTPDHTGNVDGFFSGLWHGFIMLFTFFGMLFDEPVGIYEDNNNGPWYNLGYVLGAAVFMVIVVAPFYYRSRRRSRSRTGR